MRTNRTKLFAIIFFAMPLLFVTLFEVTPIKVAAVNDDDAATMYTKFLCVACHTKTASKNFDPSKAEAVLVETILKGKKAEKPPNINMPAFETTKKMTEDQAKSLVTYMKSLKAPAN